ncbi:MAG TPA: protein-L-isoaspartate(D-aspartate) O-methyltransferase [Solirubrobacteraceae bacterium]|nr:protein-L-isoaspartate(D-aspartate) O-methyltransferase [Solirubrobacteraceae bacterium]
MSGAVALVDELRPAIGDDRVLAAIAAVPRDAFVPASLRRHAWDNTALAIGCGQTISQPLVVARMAELLDVHPGDRVLDVGTGSGYHAAVLAALGASVWSIERFAELSAGAARALRAAGVEGVELVVGDGWAGLPEHAPYDGINVAAATPDEALDGLEAQLADGGRLVAPLDGFEQRLVLARRTGDDVRRRLLEPVRFVPLVRGQPGRA